MESPPSTCLFWFPSIWLFLSIVVNALDVVVVIVFVVIVVVVVNVVVVVVVVFWCCCCWCSCW